MTLVEEKISVRSYYDEYAPKYDDFYQRIQRQKFNYLSEYLTGETNLIDLGGGSGFIAEWLKLETTNIDLSYMMLHEGLEKGRNFQGIAGDMENLPLRKNSQDLIISMTTLQNCHDPRRAIDDICRILTQSGSGLITILRKSIKTPKIISYLEAVGLINQEISLSGEDLAFQISLLQ